MTQEPSVHFAMKGFEREFMPKLATVQKDKKALTSKKGNTYVYFNYRRSWLHR